MKNPDRMCCTDDCYRNDVIFALEKDFDTEVSPELHWATDNTYLIFDDKMYFYKPKILELVKEDFDDAEELPADIFNIMGEMMAYQDTVDLISVHATANDSSMPTFIEESESFIVTENVLGTPFDLDTPDINLIDETFSNLDFNPLAGNITSDMLFVKGNKLYCVSLHSYEYNTNVNFGIFINGVFNPFRELTEDQSKYVEAMVTEEDF
jgi:hypothetical protein